MESPFLLPPWLQRGAETGGCGDVRGVVDGEVAVAWAQFVDVLADVATEDEVDVTPSEHASFAIVSRYCVFFAAHGVRAALAVSVAGAGRAVGEARVT